MASAYAIDGPQSLFALPQPLDKSIGRTLGGPAYGFVNSRKRKRSEIPIGVDGESVNVYNIKTPRLLTSHAIPLQAYLTAPPLCVYCKRIERNKFTYAAIRNELGLHKYQIYCFRENLPGPSRDVSLSNISLVKTTKDVGSKGDCAVLLEAIPSQPRDESPYSHDLILVQQRGAVSGLSADLSKEKWKISLQELAREAGEKRTASRDDIFVEHAFCVTAANAKTGLLQGREDLISSLNPTGQPGDETLEQTTLLCLITKRAGEYDAPVREHDLNVLAVQPRLQGLSRSPMRLLARWTLPKANVNTEQGQQKAMFSYNTAAGTLNQFVRGTAITYNFSALGPRVTSELRLPQDAIVSFFPLRQDLALASTPSHYYLLNLRYQSILASTPVTAADVSQTNSRKRKRSNNTNNTAAAATPAQLLDYFPSEGIAIGVLSHTLVSLPISLPSPSRSAKGSRLIDSLGRGIPSNNPNARIAPQLATSTTISALAESDPTLATLSHHLIDRQPIALSGAVEGTKHLLRSFNTPRPAPVPQTHLLTKGTGPTNTTTQPPNGDDAPEDPASAILALEDAAVTADLAHATSLLSPTALDARGKALKAAISLLGATFPAQDVARAMREQLQRRDILFLVELLRVDLEHGGWTSHILDVWPSDGGAADAEGEAGTNRDAAVAVVARVLTRAVDALGMGAWLGSTNPESNDNTEEDEDASDNDAMSLDDDPDNEPNTTNPAPTTTRTHTTISTLRTETSLVLESAQEAAWFSNFLAEFLRYEHALKTSSDPAATVSRKSEPSLLPLGVRKAAGVDATVVKAGGEVRERSRREVGMELRRRVGVYAFERVRI